MFYLGGYFYNYDAVSWVGSQCQWRLSF